MRQGERVAGIGDVETAAVGAQAHVARGGLERGARDAQHATVERQRVPGIAEVRIARRRQRAAIDAERAAESIVRGQRQGAEVALGQAVAARDDAVDGGGHAGTGCAAVADTDRRRRAAIGHQRQRIAVHHVTIAGELQAGGGNRAAAVVDRHRARGAAEDREARLRLHRRAHAAIGVGPVGRYLRPAAIAAAHLCGRGQAIAVPEVQRHSAGVEQIDALVAGEVLDG